MGILDTRKEDVRGISGSITHSEEACCVLYKYTNLGARSLGRYSGVFVYWFISPLSNVKCQNTVQSYRHHYVRSSLMYNFLSCIMPSFRVHLVFRLKASNLFAGGTHALFYCYIWVRLVYGSKGCVGREGFDSSE